MQKFTLILLAALFCSFSSLSFHSDFKNQMEKDLNIISHDHEAKFTEFDERKQQDKSYNDIKKDFKKYFIVPDSCWKKAKPVQDQLGELKIKKFEFRNKQIRTQVEYVYNYNSPSGQLTIRTFIIHRTIAPKECKYISIDDQGLVQYSWDDIKVVGNYSTNLSGLNSILAANDAQIDSWSGAYDKE